ncbi:MAG: DUF4221 family protein [Candidatus Pseudobacter hemicellulosilyticus]|uniref:DUF4221 family protein n=1 Tax=Candidatus Pseudobacter hemicellulosilyticus TaxID=3121375 RepID=A0AAJ6BHR0_9BACT|nr:MAG: DUF4221 family protein [Pseudobacter sp.]
MERIPARKTKYFLLKTIRKSMLLLLISLCLFSHYHCQQSPATVRSSFVYQPPLYSNIALQTKPDSIHFALDGRTSNAISSFNYFLDKGKPFIFFYDRATKSLLFYNFNNRSIVQKVPIKAWLFKEKFDKPVIYVINFDSIFITSKTKLFLLDSSGKTKKIMEQYSDDSKFIISDNECPAYIKDSLLLVGNAPNVKETSLPAHQKWRVITAFNLSNSQKTQYYELPTIYQSALYGYSYLNYSYCFNDRKNIVFSFAADTNIYETDLASYHKAYNAQSKLQKEVIHPISKSDIQEGKSYTEYSLQDSYGGIHFDPYHKRYLRLFKQKVPSLANVYKNRIRKRSIIIFDKSFRIIGESDVDDSFAFSTIFFTQDGKIYARVNGQDETTLHFARLDYVQQHPDSTPQLTQSAIQAK